ncbi:MAG: FtsQ-type POTRA domain-containing protein [Candidatus Gracilibacteria bacterium]
MGLFSVFKRKRRTSHTSFTSYKSARLSSRKPFVPKVSHIENDRMSRRRNEKTGRFFWYLKILLGVAVLLGALYGLFFTSLFEIRNIEVQGEADTIQEQTAIKETLQEYLGDNLLLFNVSIQETDLLKGYAYLKTLDISRNFFHTIQVTLETYPPVANVRMEFENGTNQYFVINERGFIASIGNNLENLPLIVMDVTGTDMDIPVEATPTEAAPTEEGVVAETEPDTMPDQINEELIPEEVLATLLDTAENFEGKFDMEVLEIRYLKRARELHLYTERYFSVWIDLTQDVTVQLAKLKKALTEIDIYAAPIEYIDLRISGQNGEKVIYKLVE